ncbi:hypothetical protein OG432_07990 [Streptomyces sp. NBC_00442]|uniref:hypothetical protein n=1 Tax=Streptomyces sp. NBC_00442 TaxID=2903651 RepID=UPI002E206EC7
MLPIPEYLSSLAKSGQCFIQAARRKDPDWRRDVLDIIQNPHGVGVDTTGLFTEISVARLRESLAPVGRKGAEDLLKLIAVGSLFNGPDVQFIESDPALSRAVDEALDQCGPGVEYFTNHGHAHDGSPESFLVSGFHFESLAVTLYDICLIAVGSDRILIAWRFEDA